MAMEWKTLATSSLLSCASDADTVVRGTVAVVANIRRAIVEDRSNRDIIL